MRLFENSESAAPRRGDKAVAAVILGLLAVGCGVQVGQEETAETKQAAGATTLFTFPSGVSRYLKVETEWECPWVCAPQAPSEYPLPPECWEDCGLKYKKVILSATSDYADETPVGAYINPMPREDRGCGPQAVQNLLSYYGTDLTMDQVTPVVHTIAFWGFPEIATTPDSLMYGLTTLLNYAWGVNQISTVTRHSNIGNLTDNVIPQLLNGNPVAVLVTSGTHWVVVTGWRAPDDFYVIDYDSGSGSWEPGTNLAFGGWGLGPALVTGYGGYYPRTIITTSVEPAPPYTPPPCPSPWYVCGESTAWNPYSCQCE
jgi:hypothetical protein